MKYSGDNSYLWKSKTKHQNLSSVKKLLFTRTSREGQRKPEEHRENFKRSLGEIQKDVKENLRKTLGQHQENFRRTLGLKARLKPSHRRLQVVESSLPPSALT